jgi:polyhydroxyalkanoate synthesis regulator phasin
LFYEKGWRQNDCCYPLIIRVRKKILRNGNKGAKRMAAKNRKIFCLTEGTIRTLARELVKDGELSKEKITSELVEEVRFVIVTQFRDWDTWLKEIISDVVETQSNNN